MKDGNPGHFRKINDLPQIPRCSKFGHLIVVVHVVYVIVVTHDDEGGKKILMLSCCRYGYFQDEQGHIKTGCNQTKEDGR
mmetsp:Transcript_46992/g.53073  ORF Transcript_46992/g.53073 Transcript_46992/m.53073 type:complete len:80 (-) Transcript_46992:406-645(-)